MWVVRSEIIGDIFFGKILKNTTIRKQHKLNQQTGVPLWQLPNSIAKRGPCWWDSCGYFATLLGLMKNWWWTQPPFLHIPGSLLVMVNTQAAVSYFRSPPSEGLRQGRAGLYPVLFCQPSPGTASGSFSGFFVSIISPVSLWYFSHSYAQMQYPNPFAPEAYLHDTRQQRPAMPHACSEPQSSRRMHCRHTQLSFPSYTSDLVMDWLWLQSFAMPSIKKLNCILKLSWIKENSDTK